MSEKLRLGVIGFAHMHINTLIDDFDRLENAEWVACADTPAKTPSISREFGTRHANIQRAMDHTGIKKFYQDYQEMLEAETFDLVLVCSENAQHADVIEAIAAKGAHIVVEKPMAGTLSDALRMVKAAERHDVKLIVNWPSTWSPAVRKAHELVSQGEVGDVLRFTYRNSASLGPMAYGQQISDEEKGQEWWHQTSTGGGAYMDYVCYGSNLSRWFLGERAVAAQGLRVNLNSPYGDADDNGAVMARFPKAMAIIEGSWTIFHTGVPNGPIVYGSEGTLVVDGAKVLVYKDRRSQEPTAVYDDLALPVGRESLALEVMHHLTTGEPLHPTLDVPVNIDAMALMDAGIRSAASGKQELVNDIRWNIG